MLVVEEPAVILLSILGACGGAPETAQPPTDDPEEDVGDLSDELPRRTPDPTSSLMLDIASGQRTVSDVLDVKRGFILVEVGQAPRSAERVCGDDAVEALTRLQADLAQRSQRGTQDVFTCEGGVCTHRPTTDADVWGSYRFEAPQGRHVVSVVVRMGSVPTSVHMQDELERWVDRQLRQLSGVACPAS